MTLKNSILLSINTLLVAGFIIGCGKSAPLTASEKDKDYAEVLEKSRKNLTDDRNLEQIVKAIRLFQVEIGRSPTNLSEVVQFHYLPELPEAPEGLIYHYENKTGNIQLARPRANPQRAPAPKK